MSSRAVAVIGYKNSGKTKTVEAITRELVSRGHKVVTLKHTADDINLDTPGKDTSRHREAGSTATGILQQNTAAIFLDQQLTLQQAAEKLGPYDFLIIEGFKTLDTHARIIVPREDKDLETLSNGLEIAIVKPNESNYSRETEQPLFTLNEIVKLADLVESKAYPLLPGLNCHNCGYDTCRDMGRALMTGEAEITQCVGYREDFTLKINDYDVPMNNFTRKALQNIILGFLKTLKGGEEPKTVRLEFETDD
ncbi:MAG: molybdopterin-guanine dinucleotide biosynthesis protein B [archaeon]|jgi:molybdopterin-guanine dinucleotide biosynthesis adapter protein